MQQHSKTFKMTKAGRRYMSFLAAFNTGDATEMRQYVERHFDPFSFDTSFPDTFESWYKTAYAETGGMNIHRTFLAEDDYIVVIVRSKSTGKSYLDKLKVIADEPYLITEYNHEIKPD